MTNPVEQALETAARAAFDLCYGREEDTTELWLSEGDEWRKETAVTVAAFLRRIASAPTPEMVEAGYRGALTRLPYEPAAQASWRAMATALADQVEDKHG